MNEDRFYIIREVDLDRMMFRLNTEVDLADSLVYFNQYGGYFIAILDRAGIIIDDPIEFKPTSTTVSSA